MSPASMGRVLPVLLGVILTSLIVTVGLTSRAAADSTAGSITVRIDPGTGGITLGQALTVSVTAVNSGTTPSPPLVLHLDVTDPDRTTTVDPEDWTAALSTPIGVLDPGRSRTVQWRLQPIWAGNFAVYVVALAPGLDRAVTSNVMRIEVTDRRTLNPGGILPVAVGVPLVVGGLLLVSRRSARGARRP